MIFKNSIILQNYPIMKLPAFNSSVGLSNFLYDKENPEHAVICEDDIEFFDGLEKDYD